MRRVETRRKLGRCARWGAAQAGARRKLRLWLVSVARRCYLDAVGELALLTVTGTVVLLRVEVALLEALVQLLRGEGRSARAPPLLLTSRLPPARTHLEGNAGAHVHGVDNVAE